MKRFVKISLIAVSCLFLLVIALIVAGFLFFEPISSGPYPTDQTLIDKLLVEGPQFFALMSDPKNSELQGKLQIIEVGNPSNRLIAWKKDFIGPGGYVKGYYYGRVSKESLVNSIDEIYKNDPAKQGTFYRHIKDKWYLYYGVSH